MSGAIREELQGVFRLAFSDDSLVIGPETTARDIAGWDSVTHLDLMVRIERHFGIRFNLAEINGFRDVGELEACVQRKQASRARR